jgi:hypothetical protein
MEHLQKHSNLEKGFVVGLYNDGMAKDKGLGEAEMRGLLGCSECHVRGVDKGED